MINTLAERIAAIRLEHIVRVAIDGVDASGKTMLAAELAESVQRLGRIVPRVSIDGFHRPRAQRYRRGPSSAEGYYHETTDYAAVRREVLEPLGPGGDRHYRTATFDFRADSALDRPVLVAEPDDILLLEGVFLLRPELRDCWDYRIFVHADFDVTLARAMTRDAELFGSADATEDRYRRRYIPGQQMYLAEVPPREIADVCVLNNSITNPELIHPR